MPKPNDMEKVIGVSDRVEKMVYNYLENYVLSYQYPPSIDEMAHDLYYSKNEIFLALKQLERKGLIENDNIKGKKRIRVTSLKVVRR